MLAACVYFNIDYSLPVATAIYYLKYIQAELNQVMDAVKGAAKKALSAHEIVLEHHNQIHTSILQQMKQRLTIDKISLEAAVSDAHAANQDSIAKLDTVVIEINQLHGQMREMHEQLAKLRKEQVGIQVSADLYKK